MHPQKSKKQKLKQKKFLSRYPSSERFVLTKSLTSPMKQFILGKAVGVQPSLMN